MGGLTREYEAKERTLSRFIRANDRYLAMLRRVVASDVPAPWTIADGEVFLPYGRHLKICVRWDPSGFTLWTGYGDPKTEPEASAREACEQLYHYLDSFTGHRHDEADLRALYELMASILHRPVHA